MHSVQNRKQAYGVGLAYGTGTLSHHPGARSVALLCLLSLDIKTLWEPVSNKKGNAEESRETLSNLEIVMVYVKGSTNWALSVNNEQVPLCVICSYSIALLLKE